MRRNLVSWSLACAALLALFSCASVELPGQEKETRRKRRGPTLPQGSHVDFSIGVGDLEVDIDGGPRDETDALNYRLAGEFIGGSFGGGVQFFGTHTDDDLQLGFAPPADGEFDAGGAYFHFTAMPSIRDRARFPIRVGPYFEFMGHRIDDAGLGDSDVDHFLLGTKIEFMPEVDLIKRERFRLTIYGGAHIGPTWVVTDVQRRSPSVDEADTTDALMYGFETGVRINAGIFAGALLFMHRNIDIDSTNFDDVVYTEPGREYEFEGFMFLGGVRW